MSENQEMIVGYDVTVRGQYYSADGKNRVLKNFGPVTFFLPEYVTIPNGKKKIPKTIGGHVQHVVEQQYAKRAVTENDVALWVIQRRILPGWLGDHYPDCTTFRTAHIVPGSMKRVMRPKSEAVVLNKAIEDMSMPELKAFCSQHHLAVPISAFGDVKDARMAVQLEVDAAGIRGPEGVSRRATADAANSAPAKGVEGAEGRVAPITPEHGVRTPDDGVPVDQQDAAADLLG